jgi:hypothetical protein
VTVRGVILAPTQIDGRVLQLNLSLHGWYVLSPRMVTNGAGRAVQSEPHMLLVDDVDLDSVWPAIWPMFGDCRTPGELWTVDRVLRQRAGITQRVVAEYPYDSDHDR